MGGTKTSFVLWLSLCLLVCCLGGCQADAPDRPQTPTTSTTRPVETDGPVTTVSLRYNGEDTLNPFATESRSNLELAPLLYEGLSRIDDTLTAKPALAAKWVADGTTVTVTLREGAKFSDGSAVTANDVVESFKKAKKSDNFATLLQNFRSAASASKGKEIRFTLEDPDIGFDACLSFPIIKKSGATEKAGEAPLGSGLYHLSEKNLLTVNPHAGQTPVITTVKLVSVSDINAQVHALENGTIGYLFSDLYGGNVPYTTAATTAVDIPYLIFLGVNDKRNALTESVRQAVSLAVDRDTLAVEGHSGYARSASAPFHPLWSGLAAADLSLSSPTSDTAAAKALLSADGYKTGLQTDVRRPKTLSLTLLFNSDNAFRVTTASLLQLQLASVGITVTLDPQPFSAYLKKVKDGKYDLYLGEVRLPADGSLACFFTEDGGASFGIDTESTVAVYYTRYRKGTVSLAEFLDVFQQKLPFIPLNWQKGMAAFKRSYRHITPSVLDPYYGLGNWDIQ
ncbi:MAG: hypothetical protein IJW89_00850 [Clostridia bacterium]|nr:hypothetical protein [Clostridia bacterium]